MLVQQDHLLPSVIDPYDYEGSVVCVYGLITSEDGSGSLKEGLMFLTFV